ncbi:MAG: DUF3999 domain-containing protein [Desulfobulbaceae bacterium]|nr:DUF3999 domain-containing protein [Desulfobulbaceae bacterium]
MQHLIALLLSFIFILSAAPLHGAAPTPDSFAYGITLSTTTSQPLYELPLPASVYHHAGRDDLADLRVFNNRGAVVPHLIQLVQSYSREEIQRYPLPLFPITGSAQLPLPADISVLVKRDPLGSIVDVKLRGDNEASEEQKILFYLLDCTGVEESMTSLEIFADNEKGDFYQKIIVDESDDLITWRQRGSATLATLQHHGRTLVNRKVKLDPKVYRYLRITPVSEQHTLTINKVEGLHFHSISGLFGERRSFSLTSFRQSSSPDSYLFDTGGFFPLDQIQINLEQPNSMAEVRLLSGPLPNGPMDEIWHGLVYNLTKGEEEFRNDPIFLMPNKHRYWKLEFKESEVSPGPSPQLRVSYLPDQLLFLGSGEGPFTLAYGNPGVSAPSFAMNELLQKHHNGKNRGLATHPVTAGEEFILGGTERLRPPPPPLPWKKYILWLVLLSGTGLVAKMSISLYKQLNKTKKEG